VVSSRRSPRCALDGPPAPPGARPADDLRYRDFLTVALVVPLEPGSRTTGSTIHTPGVKVGRIQNFGSWSPFLVKERAHLPGPGYFVNEGDELWSASDEELVGLASAELERLS